MNKQITQFSDFSFDPEFEIYTDYYQNKIAQVTNQGTVRIFELINKKDKQMKRLAAEFQAHQGQINSMSWLSPKYENLIATCGQDNQIKIWKEQANQWKVEKEIKLNNLQANIIQWAENKYILAVGYNNGYLEVIEGQEYKVTNTNAYNQTLLCLDWLKSDQEQIIVTGGLSENQSIVKIWNVISDSQTIIAKVYEYKCGQGIRHVKFAPQIFNSELQLVISYESCVEIQTLRYDVEFAKPIELQKSQKILLNNVCQKISWSILGNELTIYVDNQMLQYYQSEENEYLRQI
ncbi:unnamed protein product [Paramecium octaurelia]|uniref:Anaphase-promoting complex subunit 4-like WD40 domain-containing protein n=1 Tax=Paramecium octaurelia TaxID=43137 RepID=A0A8S1TKF8_PAROT|nr:unnamed protein product [Paramecium octaurelia]